MARRADGVFQQPIIAARRWTPRLQAWLVLVSVALIAASILIRPNNHDEGQYVAAIALMRSGWPYLDFAYLQTPLQPLLLSPLAAIPAGWLLVAARAVNGLFALLTTWLLFRQLRSRVQWRSAAVAIGALLCTEPFLFAASLARNDALPLLLLAGAQAAMLAATDGHRRVLNHAVAGLLFGLAISTKINAALPAAGAGVYVLLQLRRTGFAPLVGLTAGMAAGLLPCLVFAVLDPAAFRFGVFGYSLDAPRQWWTSIGQQQVLEPSVRIMRLCVLSLSGMIPVGLVAAAIDRRAGEDRRLLDLMIVGGLIGCYLPEPAFRQYLAPLLVPLAARFALAIDDLPKVRTRITAAAVGLAALLGLLPTARYALRAARHGADLVRTVEDARAVSALAAGRPVATLSPERVAGRDVDLDPRFASGPFLFRTFGELGDDALRFGHSPDWQRIDASLSRHAPGVIVVGGEVRPAAPFHPHGLDAHLQAWAVSHRYRRVLLPDGQLTAFVRRNGA